MISEILKSIIVGAPGSYNMLSLEIEIDGKDNRERNPTVFHEYTHYLQNMTTINGFVSLDKYINVLLRSFTKLGSDPVDPEIPLNSYQGLQSVLGDKNMENIVNIRLIGMDFDYSANKYYFQDTDQDDYTITEQDYFDSYNGLILTIPYVSIDGKNIPINETVIRENMALVNSIIAKPIFGELTAEDINEVLSYEYKEYNVLFDFIYHYLPNCDLLKLVYCICEMSLNLFFSEQIIGRILRLFKEESLELSKMDTDNIIQLIKAIIDYDTLFNKLYTITLEEAIKRTINIFSNFDIKKNQFIYIMKKFYEYLVKGLEYRATHKTLYTNEFTNNYIQELTTVIGCPAIYFLNENEYRSFSETPDYFLNDFIYLHGALKIYTLLYYSNITICPFSQRNICKVSKNKKCYTNCITNYEDNDYRNCLLSNSLTCTGIKQERRCNQCYKKI